MLYEWAQEEQMLDTHYKILVDEIPKPINFPRIPAMEFVLTVSYINPKIARDDLGNMLHQAFQSNKLVEPIGANSRVFVNRLLNLFNSMTTLRDSVFTRLFTSIGVSARANMGQPDLEAIANENYLLFSDLYSDSRDTRFKSVQRTHSNVKIWYHMCIEEMIANPVSSPTHPCRFDRNTDEWRMTPDTINSLRRYFVLTAIKSRQI